jgi:hypothetical protein
MATLEGPSPAVKDWAAVKAFASITWTLGNVTMNGFAE